MAFAVVVALTPAVGGMARLLGVVDKPGGRRVNRRPVPRLGGLALFLGLRRPGARVPRPEPRGARPPARRRARDDGRRGRRLPRPVVVGQARRAGRRRRRPGRVRRLGDPLHVPRARRPRAAGVARHDRDGARDRRDHEHAQLPRRARRARRRGGRDRRLHLLPDRALARQRRRPRSSRRSSSAPASASCATTSIRRGSSWATRARCCSASSLATESVQGLLKTAALATLVLPLLVLAVPILDTSFVIAKRIKYRRPLWLGDRTHLHHRFVSIGFSQRRAVVYLYAWCGILAGAALSTRFLRPRPHGEWLLWPTLGVAVVAARRARRVGLHRLPARDRQAGEPAHPPAPRRRPSGSVERQ